jgi:molybdate transport system ATP-binding protein
MDAGQVLQQGTPASIHRAPRNARVADLVGIQNRFQGAGWAGRRARLWLAAGVRRWLRRSRGGARRWRRPQAARPVLTVRDKGKLPAGQAVTG